MTRPEDPPLPVPDLVVALAARLDAEGRRVPGRSLSVLPWLAGGCDACWRETRMLDAAVHGLARLGVRVVDDPARADALLVCGIVTRNNVGTLRRARAAMAEPALVVAIGDCATGGCVFRGGYAVHDGLAAAAAAVPDPAFAPDLAVPGCPPTPRDVLAALLTVLEAQLPAAARSGPHPDRRPDRARR